MKKLVGNMVGAKGGQNWPSETFTTDTEASIHATKVLEDKHLATSPSLHPNETPWFDDGSITETVPRQSRFSRAANGKPGTFCADWETLNKFVTVHKVTKHWIQTDFEQRGVETLEKKTNISYFSL